MLLVKTAEGYVGSLMQAVEKDTAQPTTHDATLRSVTDMRVNEQRYGVRLRLDGLRLDNVAAVEPLAITLQVACQRCREPSAATLQPDAPDAAVCQPCPSCHAALEVRMAPQLLHEANDVLGRLRCTGCVAVDLLPCMLGVQCATCSAGAALRDVQVGVLATRACRRCHATMGLYIAAAVFAAVPSAPVAVGGALSHGRHTHELLEIGQPLPGTGTCRHYRHSHRWFRFPCCGQRFPCDLCHEEAVEDGHPAAWASRMVCGFCSREQAVGRECAHCGKRLATTGGTLLLSLGKNQPECAQLHRAGGVHGSGREGRGAGTRGCLTDGTGTSTAVGTRRSAGVQGRRKRNSDVDVKIVCIVMFCGV